MKQGTDSNSSRDHLTEGGLNQIKLVRYLPLGLALSGQALRSGSPLCHIGLTEKTIEGVKLSNSRTGMQFEEESSEIKVWADARVFCRFFGENSKTADLRAALCVTEKKRFPVVVPSFDVECSPSEPAMAAGPITERNQDATVYVGGLDEKVNENILWELFVQAGPVVNVHMPKDRVTMTHQGYGFVEFMSEEDADYAIKIMNMIKLYGKPIRVNKASAHQKSLDVGANIFIGNLDPEVDEKLLYDTFSAFGVILQTPKIMRDPESGNSKGYAFVNFASFDASDAAIEAMNGQYLCNRPITISYAYKKDAKGERHGSAAERLLAAQNPLAQADRPHQLFADAPPTAGVAAPAPTAATAAAIMPTLMFPMAVPPPPMGHAIPGYFPYDHTTDPALLSNLHHNPWQDAMPWAPPPPPPPAGLFVPPPPPPPPPPPVS